MATQIQLTRSGSAGGSPPNATELEYGELALNYADGKLFFKNSSNQIEQLNSTYRNSGQKIFVNESDNHIGLNTTSPAFLLDLGGSSAHHENSLRLNQNDDGTAIRIGGSAAGDITLLRVDNADGETAGEAESLSFPSSAEGFRIRYLGSNNHELGFFADNGGTEVQALTILQDGKIGIGTGTPAKLLDVQGGSARVSGNFSAGGDLTIGGNTVLGNATSDTASISGALTVDTDTLVVDESNDRVGINQATPASELDVTGSANITQSLVVGTNLTVTGNTALGNATTDTVTLTGDMTVGGNVTATTAPTIGDHLVNKTYVDTTQPGLTTISTFHTQPTLFDNDAWVPFIDTDPDDDFKFAGTGSVYEGELSGGGSSPTGTSGTAPNGTAGGIYITIPSGGKSLVEVQIDAADSDHNTDDHFVVYLINEAGIAAGSSTFNPTADNTLIDSQYYHYRSTDLNDSYVHFSSINVIQKFTAGERIGVFVQEMSSADRILLSATIKITNYPD